MTTITDAVLADAEKIVNGYNHGCIASTSLPYLLYGSNAPHLPAEVEAAFQHAAKEHREFLKAEVGDVNYAEMEPALAHPEVYAEHCRVLLDEALAGLVRAVDAWTASRNTSRSAA
jgi:hypothetical protein